MFEFDLSEVTATRQSVAKKITKICQQGRITFVTLEREFGITFSVACDIIMVLTDAGILDKNHQVVDQAACQAHLTNMVTLCQVNHSIKNLPEMIRELSEKSVK